MRSWLACTALKGMFPNEITVLVLTAEGRTLSAFVPENSVELEVGSAESLDGEEVGARVSVKVLERNDQFGLVELPGEPFEGSRVAKVPAERLTA